MSTISQVAGPSQIRDVAELLRVQLPGRAVVDLA
jgi:hypothetical protein